MIVDVATTVNGRKLPPSKPLVCTKCGALVARGLESIHNTWHRDTNTPTTTP